MYSTQLWSPQVWMEEPAGPPSLLNLWGRICPCLFLGSGACLQSWALGWHTHYSDVCLCHHMAFLLPVCLCPDSLPFIKIHSVDCVHMCCMCAQACLTLCDPMDCSPPGSSVHGILQARRLDWVAMPSPRRSSWPRDQTHISCISCIAGGLFTIEPLDQPLVTRLGSL